ncbi:MAG TPA: aminoacyl-tRNA hydrolase [Spirochaetota bacterium]|nr:aminoacyl-tRNA hydrolase [Spirochaetota bacterium]
MFILACLGNPGKKYAGNRHNVGFMFGQYLVNKHASAPSKKEFSSLTGKLTLGDNDGIILFPQTFMNLSGNAVSEACAYYRVEADGLIVVHDDIELPFGEIRQKKDGGHKGHNGLRSIMERIGSGDFHRIRIGVGRPDNPDVPVADYVLSDFLPDEKEALKEKLAVAEDMVTGIIAKIQR